MPRAKHGCSVGLEDLPHAELLKYAQQIAKHVAELESLVPHPGDGSCDKCGAVPATHVPMVLCPECYGTEKRIEEKDKEIAKLRATLARQLVGLFRWVADEAKKGGV